MLNKYNRVARIYPAILCSIPIFVLNYFLLDAYTKGFVDSFVATEVVGGISFSLVLTYLLAQISRFIGKELFEYTHFKDELHMPTTNHLLHADSTYTATHKTTIHKKISDDFGVVLFAKEQEEKDVHGARKRIVESMSFVRAKVKDGRLVLNHNREYGFARNFIGGSVVAVMLSIANLFVFGCWVPNPVAYYISLFLAIIYLFAIMFSGQIMKRYGIRYAKVLIQEYLSAA